MQHCRRHVVCRPRTYSACNWKLVPLANVSPWPHPQPLETTTLLSVSASSAFLASTSKRDYAVFVSVGLSLSVLSLHQSQKLAPSVAGTSPLDPDCHQASCVHKGRSTSVFWGSGGGKRFFCPKALVCLLTRTPVPSWGLHPDDLITPKAPPPGTTPTGV